MSTYNRIALAIATCLGLPLLIGACGQKPAMSIAGTYGDGGSSGFQLVLRDDGTAELHAPQGTIPASYTVQGQTITLTSKEQGLQPMVLKRDANGCLAPPTADNGKALCKQ